MKRADFSKYSEGELALNLSEKEETQGVARKKELPADSIAWGLGEQPSLAKLVYGEEK